MGWGAAEQCEFGPKKASWAAFFRRRRLHERFAGLYDKRFGHTETRYVACAMTCKHAMRSLRFDKLDLDH
jgi:hypothetical protein